MPKSLKFTIEVNGLDLPERAQSEISKALNKTLMHKLAELDLNKDASGDAPEANAAAPGGTFLALKDLINGGMLHRVQSPDLFTAFRQFQTKFNIPDARGDFNVTLKQM